MEYINYNYHNIFHNTILDISCVLAFIMPIPGHTAELGSFMIHRGHTPHVAKAE